MGKADRGRYEAVASGAAESQFVAVGVAVERLAYAVGVREALVGLEAAGSDRGHVCIEIVEEDRVTTELPAPSACSTM